MGVVNIVTPPLNRRTFTGGALCLLEHAKGLTRQGHVVNILPLLPSARPRWIGDEHGRWCGQGLLVTGGAEGDSARSVSGRLRDTAAAMATAVARVFPHDVQHGFHMRFVRNRMPPADVTLATSFDTALPVHLHGQGRLFYFLQHFEPYFAVDLPDRRWAEYQARESYGLGLRMIANSSWLQARIREETGIEPLLCHNAIDHGIFATHAERRDASDEIRVISYGGRKATWKGFREMAAAMRLVRAALPHRLIRWLVYGDCLMPPDNEVASYEPLGFLQHGQLARAYRDADILLSASWYESFPLYPLEAMACGLPVITTQLGTEEFALHERTAEVVQPRDPESIAQGLRRLIEQPDYRAALGHQGREISRHFTWDAASRQMASLLFDSR